jgi:hypothetical protein
VPIYPLAKDYGATLKSYVIAKRLNAPNLLEAAKRNLQTGPSFDEWSFA